MIKNNNLFLFIGLSVKDYAAREGHSKVVNQLSMQKMSVMARTRSKENVLDDLDRAQVQENKKNLNNITTENVQNAIVEEVKLNKSKTVDNQSEKENLTFNPSVDIDNKLKIKNSVDDKEKKNVTLNFTTDEPELKKCNIKEGNNEIENLTLDSKLTNTNGSKVKQFSVENNQNEKENVPLNLGSIIKNDINNSSIEQNKEVVEKNESYVEEKNVFVATKDEESVSQCTMPPPMDPPRSWDFIQTSIIQTTETNKSEKDTQENIVQIPEPIVCAVNTDDSELEWGSDESLPTDPNQTGPIVDNKKEDQKVSSFFNFITTKVMNPKKHKVFASADSITSGTHTHKHVRNKSCTSLSTFKLTVPSDLNKVLDQLSPEMNFAHSSFSKSKSFNEQIPIDNVDKNSLEFERSKSLCLELKHNSESSENQHRDSDSQSDDSLRSKRSLLLSMRMPKVHDEHHDDCHLEVKDSETSEDEGPHYWYSPNKKNDRIVQQDTVIRNNSESEDSE